jgi:cytochrome c5
VTARRLLLAGALLASGSATAADAGGATSQAQVVYESSIGGVVAASGLAGLAGRGFLVYNKWCTGCHAGDFHPSGKNAETDKLSLVSRVALGTYVLQQRYQGAVPAELDKRTDLTPAMIEAFVRRGVNAMPAFRKTEISDDDLKALGAYLARPRS